MISVIMPAYNAERFVCTMMDSLLAQTYTDFEIIAVDDGSTDNTFAVLQGYENADKRVKAFTQPNGGPSAARNKGISLATGEYMVFVDSDDRVPENYLERLAGAADNADLVVCGRKMHLLDGMVLNFQSVNKKFDIKEFVSETIKCYFDPINAFIGPVSKMFKTSLVKENGMQFNTKYKLGEDTVFGLEYLKHCKTVNTTDDTYYDVIETAGSLCRTIQENHFAAFVDVRKNLETLMVVTGFNNTDLEVNKCKFLVDYFFGQTNEILKTELTKKEKVFQLGKLLESGIINSKDVIIARGKALPWRLLSAVIKTKSGTALLLWFIAAPKMGV